MITQTNDHPNSMSGKKDVKDMTVEELRREIFRLRHKTTELGNKVKSQAAVIAHLKESDFRKMVEAVRQLIPPNALRRLG